MMYHRLLLAKNLLKKDGILIVAIDDNELFRLGILLEELFPAYELYTVTVEHNRRGRRGKNFAKTNEWALFLVPRGSDLILEQRSEVELGGETRNLRRTGSGSKRSERPRKFYPIYVNKKTLEVLRAGDPLALNDKFQAEDDGKIVAVWPIDEQGREKNWHYGVERTRVCIENDQLEARVQDYGIQVYYTLRKKDSKKYKTVWSGSEFDASTYGSVLLEKILGEAGKFEYPKSINTVLECMKATIGDRKNAIVVDFFAGSGTTGHAVMLLNEEDGGKRQFILCTNNENNISREVTYPRIKKVITGYNNTKGIPTNLRYFKTAFVPKSTVSDDTRYKLVQRSTDMICVREDTYETVSIKSSYKVFGNATHYTAILFDIDKLKMLKETLAALEDKPIHIYVFSLTNDTYENDFSDLNQSHKLCPIPESILEVYRRIFKERAWN
jgi:adenine-specific DNA-methyltransferase